MVGGAAVATRLLCEALAQSGARVTLFVTLQPSAEVVKALEIKGISVITPAFKWGWRYQLPQLALALGIWARARITRPSLIHFVGISREARELLRMARVSPIYVWDTTEALPGNKFVDVPATRLLRRARAVLVPSATIERNVRSTYKYEGLVGRLPFWCQDVPKLPERDVRYAPRSKILYFGRLDPEKGLSDLIEAYAIVRKEVASARVTICGGGSLQQAIGQDSLPDGIEFAGRVSEEELDRQIRDADVVVLPSLHEGYPISLLEACARSTPIVATAVGSIPGLFTGRACALLVPPHNPQRLAEALVTILTEPAPAYAERRADSRALFEEVSSTEVVLANLRSAYV